MTEKEIEVNQMLDRVLLEIEKSESNGIEVDSVCLSYELLSDFVEYTKALFSTEEFTDFENIPPLKIANRIVHYSTSIVGKEFFLGKKITF